MWEHLLSAATSQRRKAARARVCGFCENLKPCLHCDNFSLLPGNDFLGQAANERIVTSTEIESGHLYSTFVMRNHLREKIRIGITGWRRAQHVFMHPHRCFIERAREARSR